MKQPQILSVSAKAVIIMRIKAIQDCAEVAMATVVVAVVTIMAVVVLEDAVMEEEAVVEAMVIMVSVPFVMILILHRIPMTSVDDTRHISGDSASIILIMT